MVALTVGLYWVFFHVHSPDLYVTSVGDLQTVRLADGSVVTLNTNTRLRAYIRVSERLIEVDSGEAYFAVAKYPSRPFVIHVADKQLTAVGTEFSVRRELADVQVLVTAGRVQLTMSDKSEAPRILDAGTLARTARSAVVIEPVSRAEAEQLLSWRSGFLSFNSTSLADAVTEFNRYQAHKLVLADPSLATIRIGGRFQTNHVEAFLSLLQQGFPIAVENNDDRILIKRRTQTRE
jgi:transmembrane sensor